MAGKSDNISPLSPSRRPSPALALLRRDLRLSFRRGSEGAATLFFFIVAASLFPFAFGNDAALLARAAPGILWIAALLAQLLSLETIYHRDAEDGTFDLLLMSSVTAFEIALAKMLAHWLASGLPLVLASVLLAPMLRLPPDILPAFLPSLLLGTLYMSLLGGMGAALTFGARRPGLLLALLALPLMIPMLITGMAGMEAALDGLPVRAYLLLQLALVVAGLPLTAGAAALLLNMNRRS